MFINIYCTDFMFQEVMVCNIFIFNIVSHHFQFPFSFQDISKSLLKFMSTGFNYEIYS